MRVARWLTLSCLTLLLFFPIASAHAEPPGNQAFTRTWARTDQPVAASAASRTWMWGVEGFTGAFSELYVDSPNSMRVVQYFDKSRMELTNPGADPASPWYVTNGLLSTELITGRMQLGNSLFATRAPANVNVAGDPDDPEAPTYASFANLLGAPVAAHGSPITQRLSRAGNITSDPSLAARGVMAAHRVQVPGIDHEVASPFWDFMNSSGLVYENGTFVQDRLFPDPFYATGYPITEAYWANVTVATLRKDVLIQCFERRCLTFTPENPEGWKVESGNVGQHYFTWRYGDPAVYERNRQRAVVAYSAMQEAFYDPAHQLYRGDIDGTAFAYHWPYSQAVTATLAMAGIPQIGAGYLPDVAQRLSSGERYFNPNRTPPGYDSAVLPPLGPGGDLFYDDNGWIGLNLIQAYRLTGNQDALRRAGQVFDVLVSGWDTNPSHPAPGGVYWTMAPWSQDRNTVSTAPAAELGLHLYELTTDPARRAYYLTWATRMYDWVNTYMRAPNGLFWDHIDPEGNIDKTQWSYNQGTMIGANVLFYRVTGDTTYLDRAQAIADASLDLYGADNGFFNQPVIFNAIFFKNLLLLEAEQHDPRYVATMQAYTDRVWDTLRDPATNLFVFSESEQLLDQAAVVQLYALLAWDSARYAMLA